MRLIIVLALVCAPLLYSQDDPVRRPAPKAGQSDIRDGEEAFTNGDMEKAVQHFTAALKAQPENDELYAYRAAAYIALGKPDKADADLAEAMKLDTTFSLAWNTRGYLHWQRAEFQLAIDDYTAAIAYAADDRRVDDGGRAQMYQNRGVAWQDLGNTDRALLDFDTCIELVPGYAAFYENRGLIYVDKQLFDVAFRDFDRALELDSKNARGYVNRAWTARLMGDFEQSVRDYSQALRIKQDYGQALIGRGYAWLAWGRKEVARTDFERAMKVDGYGAPGETGLGELELSLGRADKAEEHFKLALDLDSGSLDARSGVVQAQLARKDYASASINGELLCELAPGVARYWSLLADTHLALEAWEPALIALSRALELAPEDLTTRRKRLRCRARLGLFKAAQNDASCIGQADHWAGRLESARVDVLQNTVDSRLTAINTLRGLKGDGQDISALADDPDFASLKNDERFQKLLSKD